MRGQNIIVLSHEEEMLLNADIKSTRCTCEARKESKSNFPGQDCETVDNSSKCTCATGNMSREDIKSRVLTEGNSSTKELNLHHILNSKFWKSIDNELDTNIDNESVNSSTVSPSPRHINSEKLPHGSSEFQKVMEDLTPKPEVSTPTEQTVNKNKLRIKERRSLRAVACTVRFKNMLQKRIERWKKTYDHWWLKSGHFREKSSFLAHSVKISIKYVKMKSFPWKLDVFTWKLRLFTWKLTVFMKMRTVLENVNFGVSFCIQYCQIVVISQRDNTHYI